MDLMDAVSLDAVSSNGFAAIELADGALPIFNVESVQLQFSIAADFVAGQVANNVIILALSNGRILRIDLSKPEDIDGGQPIYLSSFDSVKEKKKKKGRASSFIFC